MQGAGGEFLAGAALAFEQNAQICRRHPLDDPGEFLDRRALADDAGQQPGPLHAVVGSVLGLEAGDVQGALDAELEQCRVHRLAAEIMRAGGNRRPCMLAGIAAG